jgi:hypothetical protein
VWTLAVCRILDLTSMYMTSREACTHLKVKVREGPAEVKGPGALQKGLLGDGAVNERMDGWMNELVRMDE